jgi:putative ABC transport system ATP-binding protein
MAGTGLALDHAIMPSLYSARGLSYRYALGQQTVSAVRDVSLEIATGELVALAGPSGSGKTTLLNLLGLLDTPRGGELLFEGRAVGDLREGERVRIRRDRVGFISQAFNLIPVLTAYENVEYFLLKRGGTRAAIRQRVTEVLGSVGLAREARQRPGQMSGGQRQRVAIARALARETHVILADEPTASLDQETGRTILELMRRLNRERGVTFVLTSHDPQALAAADRVIKLADGRIA